MILSIIIPVYNEEKTILKVLRMIKEVDFGIPFELIAVNDGSTDKTKKQILKAKEEINKLRIISYSKNKGKGYAIRKGVVTSKGDIIIIQDADLEYDPNEITKLIKPMLSDENTVVYGSRFLGKHKNMSLQFLLGNKFLTFITNLLFNSKLTDMETCYKLINKHILEQINLKSDGFEIEAEITAKILKNNYRIKEIPINYVARTKKGGKKIKWVDGLKNLMVLFQIRFNL